MFSHRKIIALSLIFLGSLAANGNVETSEIVASSGKSDLKLKNFIVLAERCFKSYKDNPALVANKLDAVASDCSIHVINSCNRTQFLELTRFKLKNSKGDLFEKLGYLMINILSDVMLKTLNSLDYSEEEIAKIQALMSNIDLEDNCVEIAPSLSPSKNNEIRVSVEQILEKFNPVLDMVLGQNLGVNSDLIDEIKQKITTEAVKTLTEDQIRELHKLVTKHDGAFDKIVDEIDAVWSILLNGLKLRLCLDIKV